MGLYKLERVGGTGLQLPRAQDLGRLVEEGRRERDAARDERAKLHRALELERAQGSLGVLSAKLLQMFNEGDITAAMQRDAKENERRNPRIDLGSYWEFNNQGPNASETPHFVNESQFDYSDVRGLDAIVRTAGYQAIKSALVAAKYDKRNISLEDVTEEVEGADGKKVSKVVDRRIILRAWNKKSQR